MCNLTLKRACLGRMLKRWERREGAVVCVERVEDVDSVGVDGLDGTLGREGITSGCGEEVRGLARRSGATKHPPNRRDQVFDRVVRSPSGWRSAQPDQSHPDPPAKTTRPSPPLPDDDADDSNPGSTMSDYKASKEAFVSGMTGSSVTHINIISTVALVIYPLCWPTTFCVI